MSDGRCEACGQRMADAEGCINPHPDRWGVFGTEDGVVFPLDYPDEPRCWDCHVRLGQPHHEHCLSAWCLRRGDQVVCCECIDEAEPA